MNINTDSDTDIDMDGALIPVSEFMSVFIWNVHARASAESTYAYATIFDVR